MTSKAAFEKCLHEEDLTRYEGMGFLGDYVKPRTRAMYKAWQASRSDILAMLDSPEMVEHLKETLKTSADDAEYWPERLLNYVATAALAAIKERLSK